MTHKHIHDEDDHRHGGASCSCDHDHDVSAIPSEEEIVDEIQFEETDEDGNAQSLNKKLKEVRAQLKEALKEKADYLANLQKERADFINYKKDDEARRKQTLDYARMQFVEELLPVLDAYDMAFANKDAWEKVEKNWRVGVEYIHQQLLKVLADNGVTEIAPKVNDFTDINLHDVMGTEKTDDNSLDHKIAQVMQKGYKTGEKVIRPARVKVYELKN